MQLKRKNIQKKLKIGFLGFVWVAGLLLAGSDGPAMPWLNLLGLLVFLLANILLGKVLHMSQVPTAKVLPGGPGLAKEKSQEKKRKTHVNTRYAGGWSTV